MDDFEKANISDDPTMSHERIMWYYSGQIHIRNILNAIQHELYPPEGMLTWPRSFGTELIDLM